MTAPGSQRRAPWAAPSWAALGGAAAALVWLGHGRLAAPPLAHPTRLALWWAARSPLVATAACLRLVLLGAAGYLLLLGLAASVVRRGDHPRLLRSVLRAAPCGPARAALVALSAASTGAVMVGGPAFASRAPAPPAPVMRLVGTPAAPATPAATPEAGLATTPAGATRYVVRPGDDLWSIAEAALTRAWGRPPDPRSLGSYWWRVVQVNRDRMPVPGDANLLFPGDGVIVPPAPPVPR